VSAGAAVASSFVAEATRSCAAGLEAQAAVVGAVVCSGSGGDGFVAAQVYAPMAARPTVVVVAIELVVALAVARSLLGDAAVRRPRHLPRGKQWGRVPPEM